MNKVNEYFKSIIKNRSDFYPAAPASAGLQSHTFRYF